MCTILNMKPQMDGYGFGNYLDIYTYCNKITCTWIIYLVNEKSLFWAKKIRYENRVIKCKLPNAIIKKLVRSPFSNYAPKGAKCYKMMEATDFWFEFIWAPGIWPMARMQMNQHRVCVLLLYRGTLLSIYGCRSLCQEISLAISRFCNLFGDLKLALWKDFIDCNRKDSIV